MDNIYKTVLEVLKENSSTIHIVGGIVVALLFILFRNKLARGILNVVSLVLFKKDETKKNALKKSLQKPFSAFFVVTGIFLGVYINLKFPFIIKSYKIAVILVICWAMINYLSDNLILFLHFGDNPDEKINTTVVKFISNILKILIATFAVVMVISELGYNINGLITGIGVGGLAVSLAAQDAISNLISGFVIVLEKPFVDGEYISAKSIEGTVVEVTMRSTKIRTLDDSLVTIPNKTLTDDVIVNISRMEKRLIDIEFGLLYSTPNELMKKCQSDIKEFLKSNEIILDAPIRVEFERFDDSWPTLNVFCYTTITDIHKYKTVLSDVNYSIKEIIEKNGAEFAYPSTSIYIEKK